MNTKQAKHAIKHAIERNIVPILLGPPGVGKSDIVKQLAKELSRPFKETRPAQHPIEDYIGIPVLSTDRKSMNFAFPSSLPKEDYTLFFIDEFPQATPNVQGAMSSIILDREINGHKLPDNTAIILAGNRQKDRASTFAIPSHIKDRVMFIDVEFNKDSWCEWATKNEVEPCAIAFIKFRPTLLTDFNPAEDKHCTARSFTQAAKCLSVEDNYLRFEMLKGLIGDGPASELNAYLKIWQSLPEFSAILESPNKIPLTEKPDIQYAITEMVSTNTTIENFPTVMQFIERLPIEFQMNYIISTNIRLPQIGTTNTFLKFISTNKSIIL